MTRPEDIPQHVVDAALTILTEDEMWMTTELPSVATRAIAAALDALFTERAVVVPPDLVEVGMKTVRVRPSDVLAAVLEARHAD